MSKYKEGDLVIVNHYALQGLGIVCKPYPGVRVKTGEVPVRIISFKYSDLIDNHYIPASRIKHASKLEKALL